MRGGEAMWCTWIVDLFGTRNESGRLDRRILDRNDLVVIAVQDQGPDIHLLKILCEISFGEGLDTLVGVLEASLHTPEPELIQRSLGDFSVGSIGAIEGYRHVLIELRAVLDKAVTQVVEDVHLKPLGIGGSFQHDRWHCSNEGRLGQSVRSMARDIPDDLAAPSE
jgi:hypothetical protein